MAVEVIKVKQLQDIEIAVIGNLFCLLMGSAGLLAGAMAANLSLDYWQEDIVSLLIMLFMTIRLISNLVNASTLYQGLPELKVHRQKQAAAVHARENIQPEPVVTGQIPAVSSYTPEQVIEEVAKRIEEQKASAIKKHVFTK